MIDRSYQLRDSEDYIAKDARMKAYILKKKQELENKKKFIKMEKEKEKVVQRKPVSKRESMMLEGESKDFFKI